MKAVVIHQYGSPEVLKYEEVPDPVPGLNEVVVKVHAVSVNRVLDVGVRQGTQGQRQITLPLVPGVDPSGIVSLLGEGVTSPQVGDRVVVRQHVPCLRCKPCLDGKMETCERTERVGIQRWGGMQNI